MLRAATAQRIRDVVDGQLGARSYLLLGRSGHSASCSRPAAAPQRAALAPRMARSWWLDAPLLNSKPCCAALDARPGRPVIVTDDDNFPTDRYVLEGIAARPGGALRMIHSDPVEGVSPAAVAAAVGPDTALVCLSHVAYRSGALADMAGITRLVHEAGAMVLWDLCHAAGSVPVSLDDCGADLAAGCTYKYLNAGPGAPAFLYVRNDLQERLRPPIQGWFGQRDQFAMGTGFDPAPGIARFAAGTPNILGTVAVRGGRPAARRGGHRPAAGQGHAS